MQVGLALFPQPHSAFRRFNHFQLVQRSGESLVPLNIILIWEMAKYFRANNKRFTYCSTNYSLNAWCVCDMIVAPRWLDRCDYTLPAGTITLWAPFAHVQLKPFLPYPDVTREKQNNNNKLLDTLPIFVLQATDSWMSLGMRLGEFAWSRGYNGDYFGG